jgi:hypothetical protein
MTLWKHRYGCVGSTQARSCFSCCWVQLGHSMHLNKGSRHLASGGVIAMYTSHLFWDSFGVLLVMLQPEPRAPLKHLMKSCMHTRQANEGFSSMAHCSEGDARLRSATSEGYS